MSGLPTGTVTFLFTDIEGSTRLLQHLGDAGYSAILADHWRLLRAAVAAQGGREIETQGDGCLVAFGRAGAAVSAAIEAQHVILRHAWPDGVLLRVRMGLHTGEPLAVAGGYVGLDVHRAARICSAGHGGQILLSRTTAGLVGHDLPAGASLENRGACKLKDLHRPVDIYQLVHPDLPARFPPLQTLDALPNNIPIQLTSFIGRERELADGKRMQASARLLTLTGAGGTGKTRLALQIGAEVLEEYPHGVWLVELAGVTDPALVPQAAASALGVGELMAGEEGASPGRSVVTALIAYLRDKSLLLILDNCEHLVAACERLAVTLLSACPHLRILATSREALGAPGETIWSVPPLSLPDHQPQPSLDTLVQFPAVRLFVERAVAASPGFTLTRANAPAVRQICSRLDGIPLAIELAAARVRVLSAEQIAARLHDLFRLLTRGIRTALRHQETLQAAMDWSYNLLTPSERTVFRRLAAFATGFTLNGAEFVCAGDAIAERDVLDLLSHLIDKSLVVVEESRDEARYRMLETIRQYSADRLRESGEEARVRGRHADWHARLADEAEPHLHGPDQAAWFRRLEQDHDNLRAALEWSLTNGEVEVGLRLTTALYWFWHVRGYFTAGREIAEGALERGTGASLAARAGACRGAALLAWDQGDYPRAEARARESLNLAREAGDQADEAHALTMLGLVAHRQSDHKQAVLLYSEALAAGRETVPWIAAMDLMFLGEVALNLREHARAEDLYREALTLFQELGDVSGIAYALYQAGKAASQRGDDRNAADLFEQSLGLFRELGNKGGIVYNLKRLGRVVLARDDIRRAGELFEEGLSLTRELGDRRGVAFFLHQSALAAYREGDYARSAARLIEGLLLNSELQHRKGVVDSLGLLGDVAAAMREPTRAARLRDATRRLEAEPDQRPAILEQVVAEAVTVFRGPMPTPRS